MERLFCCHLVKFVQSEILKVCFYSDDVILHPKTFKDYNVHEKTHFKAICFTIIICSF